MNNVRAAVVGASGYAGLELAGLISRHPRIDLVCATSEAEAGAPVPGAGLRYVPAAAVDFGAVDVVFTCLPTGESGEWALRAAAAGAVTVDLSGDLRDGRGGAVYGLPELWRLELAGARLVSNPGCYPTGVLVALAPAIRHELVDGTRPVVIDAASGVTGAGRSGQRELLFGEVAEEYRAYGVGNVHRHVPEMRRGVARLSGGPEVGLVFTPHLLPVRRGIMETIYLPLRSELGAADAAGLWSETYAEEPFVEVVGDELPTLRRVVGRNVVALGFSAVQGIEPPMLVIVAALDNLVKGAAGQALQNANLLLGFPERDGLPA